MSSGKKKRGEEKKKLRELQALAHKAAVLRENDSEREAADKYMEAVLAAPSVWTKNRYVAFNAYCDIVCKSVTKNDAKWLKRHFLWNEEEPAPCSVPSKICFLGRQVFCI